MLSKGMQKELSGVSAGGFRRNGGRSWGENFQTEERKCCGVMWRKERVFRGRQQGLLPGANTHLTPILRVTNSFWFAQDCPDFSTDPGNPSGKPGWLVTPLTTHTPTHLPGSVHRMAHINLATTLEQAVMECIIPILQMRKWKLRKLK